MIKFISNQYSNLMKKLKGLSVYEKCAVIITTCIVIVFLNWSSGIVYEWVSFAYEKYNERIEKRERATKHYDSIW
tara:strand:+ start:125 stop:349 length:225 start_codon:yes stop_codon:yes gene_type:complete